MNMPVDLKSVLEAAKSVEEARNIPVAAVVLVDESAPAELITRVEDHFEPQSPGASVGYFELGRAPYDENTDFVCIVAGGDRRVGQAAQYVRAAGVPCAIVASSPDFVEGRAKESGYPIPDGDLLDGSDGEEIDGALGRWVLAVCKNKKLAVAQAFAFCRRPLALESIKATSLQNAGIGAVAIIPGADMPVMTLNQIKMLLQIAASYGQPMDAGRAKELAAVVGGGFAARTVARELVGLVPVGGWAVKGGIGYTATMAMGYAALNYFEGGGGVSGLGSIATAAADKAVKGMSGAKVLVKRGKDAAVSSKPAQAASDAVHTVTAVAGSVGHKTVETIGVAAGRVKAAGKAKMAKQTQKAQVNAAKRAEESEAKAAARAEAAQAKAEKKSQAAQAKEAKKAVAAQAKEAKATDSPAKPRRVKKRVKQQAATQIEYSTAVAEPAVPEQVSVL